MLRTRKIVVAIVGEEGWVRSAILIYFDYLGVVFSKSPQKQSR